MKNKELKITIKPYGTFKAVEVGEPSLKNCGKCWFGQRHKEPTHCPEGYRCVIEKGGKRYAFVFVKTDDTSVC